MKKIKNRYMNYLIGLPKSVSFINGSARLAEMGKILSNLNNSQQLIQTLPHPNYLASGKFLSSSDT